MSRKEGKREKRSLAYEECAQSTLEYALTLAALMAVVAGLAAVWRAGEDGTLARLVEAAAPYVFSGTGAFDIALF